LTPFPIDINTGNSVCTGGVDIDPTTFDFTQPFVIPDPVPAGGFKIYACTMDQAGNEVFGEAEYNWRKPIPPTPNIPDAPGVPNTGFANVIEFMRNNLTFILPLLAVIALVVAGLLRRYTLCGGNSSRERFE
jgi:hypothetical protein